MSPDFLTQIKKVAFNGVQTFFFQKALMQEADRMSYCLYFRSSEVSEKQEESLCNISTDIDRYLGRFIRLEIETVFSSSKKTALRLMVVAQGCFIRPKIVSFILTIH